MGGVTDTATCYPPWVVLHVPHDAVDIPAEVRDQFVLDETPLQLEVLRMTDHCTAALFAGGTRGATLVRAPVSRLVVDVERFADDSLEPMAQRGMGVVYQTTSQLQPLRRALTAGERESLLASYYRPHHNLLEAAVDTALASYGRCLVIDCHSFPDRALPYEQADATTPRPDICIGTDAFHTSSALAGAFTRSFAQSGWRVAVNDPFAGALVPASRYRRDDRVQAVMVEVNRGLYMDETTGINKPEFADVSRRLLACLNAALIIVT